LLLILHLTDLTLQLEALSAADADALAEDVVVATAALTSVAVWVW
jgi:hypothetical protein